MVSKNNHQILKQRQTNQVPHYGLRKLSIGVASVLLSTTFYLGAATAHADTNTSSAAVSSASVKPEQAVQPSAANTTQLNAQSQVAASAQPSAADTTQPDSQSQAAASAQPSAADTTQPDSQSQAAASAQPSAANTTQPNAQSQAASSAQPATNTTKVLTKVLTTISTRAGSQATPARGVDSAALPATAWQPTPTVKLSADQVVTIDRAGQPQSVQGAGWQMTLDKNYIKLGQDTATLKVKYVVDTPGEVFILDLGYPSSDLKVDGDIQGLSSSAATIKVEREQVGKYPDGNPKYGLRTQVIVTFHQTGTYNQEIKLAGLGTGDSREAVLQNLQASFGDRAYDLIIKKGSTQDNAQAVGRLYLIGSFTPTMQTAGGRTTVQSPANKVVPVLSTNNNYLFNVAPGWSDRGALLDPTYNGDFTYSIAVPSTFELDQAATAALYQRGGNDYRTLNVTASQAGVGAPVIIRATALKEFSAWHNDLYGSNQGVAFLGHFTDAPSTATLLQAPGQTVITDTVGGHVQTITLPGLEATVINAANYDRNQVWLGGDKVVDFGDLNERYQAHEVPITDASMPINLIDQMYVTNASPFDVENATVTMTFGDGVRVQLDSSFWSVNDHRFHSAFNLADSPVEITYQDGTHETVAKGETWSNLTKNIKSATWTMANWNSGQQAGIAPHGLGIAGCVATHYQDGRPVQFGDQIQVTLDVQGINTAGYHYQRTLADTLTVVDLSQHLSPTKGTNYYGGVEHFGLGDDPSGTSNFHWERTSGIKGLIKWQNPTFYYVMPQTVSRIQNIHFQIPGWVTIPDYLPALDSVDYVQSKDGQHTVAVIKFKGTYTNDATNQWLYFDNVNKDNVVNQTSLGYLYWTADNVNSDAMTQAVDKLAADDHNRPNAEQKAALLPATLTAEALDKIYYAFWTKGKIDVGTGMYSYGNVKATDGTWGSKGTIDYHSDGHAAVGVSLVNNSGNELKNIVAIVAIPKTSDGTHLPLSLTGAPVELLDANTNQVLANDGITVLYSTKAADLTTNDLSAFVPASEITDWTQVQAVALKLSSLAGKSSRQLAIPVVAADLLEKIGKSGKIGIRVAADGLLPIVTTVESDRAAQVVIGGQATIEAQMHYKDGKGQDHIIAMPNVTKHFDVTKPTVLNKTDFMPTKVDQANIPAGYALSSADPTVVKGTAKLGEPVTAAMDQSVLQFELVPTPQQIKVNYVDDDNNQAVIKAETLTGVTDQTVTLNLSLPKNYVLEEPAPSNYTFKATGNADITIHLRHETKDVSATDPYAKFERTYSIVQKIPQITHDVNGNVTYTPKTLLDKWKFNMQRTATQDLVTGKISYGSWEVDPADVDGPNGIHSPEFSIDKIAHTKLTSPIGASEDLLLWWTLENTPEKYQEYIKSLGLDPDQVVALVSVGGFDGNNGINDRQKKRFDQGIALGAGVFKSLNSTHWDLSFWVAGSSHNALGLLPVYHDYAKTFDLQWKTGLSDTPYDDLKELFPASQTIELISEPVTIPVTIKYVDSTTGQVVEEKSLTTTNYYQDFLIPDQTPAGYAATDAGAFTKHHSVRPTAGDALQTTFEIQVNHKLVKVTPDDPKKPNDKLPDNPTKSYPSGVGANDLNKTVTRTIKVTDPTGQITTTKQTAHLTRTAVVDEATGELVRYSDWTSGRWQEFKPQPIAGYTPTIPVVAAQTVDETTPDKNVEIAYTANEHVVDLDYVDRDGNIIATEPLKGKTGDTIKIVAKAPAGWRLVANQTVPTELTFTATDQAPLKIVIEHAHTTVTPDDPKTPNDKLPDNPTKSYPSGVSANDLNKTVTRTIKVIAPTGQVTTTKQTVHLTRTAEVDEVTLDTTYSPWSTGKWDQYNVPGIAGYTASQSTVAAQTVTVATDNQLVKIMYTPNAHNDITVQYVDDDNHGKVVQTRTLSGQTDQTLTITPVAPTGYDLVDSAPISYQVTAQPRQVVSVHVKHHINTTTEKKLLTRTIELHTPHDGVKVVKQTAELMRQISTDQATGAKTYGQWSTGKWDQYSVPEIAGYTASQSTVAAQTVTDATDDQLVKITYTPNAHNDITVQYVDDDNHGKVVQTRTLSGQTDQMVTIKPVAPTGYVLVDATPVDYRVTDQSQQVVTFHVKHQRDTTTVSKTLTRTIELHTPFDGVKTIKQVAELTRPVTVDRATGQTTFGAWSTGTWDAYQVPTYAGYEPTVAQVPAVHLDGNATDQTVVINYLAQQHTTHINYVDETGKLIHTTTLSGKTDEVVAVPNEVPTGWQLVAGQTLPSELTFTATGYPDTTVVIKHRLITIPADNPQADGTPLPDNPGLTFHGVDEAALNRVVTRQIMLNIPGKAAQTITQTVHLTREAVVDEVTGEVTYGNWTTGEWEAVPVPVIAGYTPSQREVPAVKVTATTKSQVITINYTALPTTPTPTKPQVTVAGGDAKAPATNAMVPTTPAPAAERRLPQTGNQTTSTSQILGLLVAGLATGLGLWRGKKKDQQG